MEPIILEETGRLLADKKCTSEITLGKWCIAIDDGCSAYKATLVLDNRWSIHDLFTFIQDKAMVKK